MSDDHALGQTPNANSNTKSRPNIVVILCDDLGYGDVQPLNEQSKIPTPNFSRLANEGMTFTDAHSPSAVCTPTRYGVMCGRYPWRSKMKQGVLGGYSRPLIEPKRQTIAAVLKDSGYTTCCVGKWHLGLGWQWKEKPPKNINNMGIAGGKAGMVDYAKPLTSGPTTLGFDQSLIIPASLDMSPYVYIRNDRVTKIPTKILPGRAFPAFYRTGELADDFKMDEVLDRLTSEACKFIADSSKKDKPFFLYFPLSAPHKPVLPHGRFEGNTKFGPYGDFITQVDWTIGQVLKALDESGTADNTLLVVTSDNGSFMYEYTDPKDHSVDPKVHGYHPDKHRANSVLRGTKGDIWEAGHRVPFFVRWPAKVKAATRTDVPVCHTDILATAAQLANAEFDQEESEDSHDLTPILMNRADEFLRAPIIHQSGGGYLAVRSGKWKLVLANGSGGRQQPRGQKFQRPFNLFDLSKDIGETTNVVEQFSDVEKRLLDEFDNVSKGQHLPPTLNNR